MQTYMKITVFTSMCDEKNYTNNLKFSNIYLKVFFLRFDFINYSKDK